MIKTNLLLSVIFLAVIGVSFAGVQNSDTGSSVSIPTSDAGVFRFGPYVEMYLEEPDADTVDIYVQARGPVKQVVFVVGESGVTPKDVWDLNDFGETTPTITDGQVTSTTITYDSDQAGGVEDLSSPAADTTNKNPLKFTRLRTSANADHGDSAATLTKGTPLRVQVYISTTGS